MIRAFVALPLPEDLTRDLTLFQAGLPVGRLVPPENFHVTLAFLGEHPATVLEDLHFELERITAPLLTVAIKGLGLFGDEKPRSLHARIAGSKPLAALRAKILRAAQQAEIDLRRQRYLPHVTLARFGSKMTPDDRLALDAFVARRAGAASAPVSVDRFTLYRSYLGKTAPVYEALADYPLG